jgi:choline monooxygenase
MRPLDIHPDITRARTLPASFYRSAASFAWCREHVFARSWQLACSVEDVKTPGRVHPFVLLPGVLDEPLLATRDDQDRLHVLSNVCTHRGNLVAETPCQTHTLRCRYHGRRFGLDGSFRSMPAFEEVEGFPSGADDLPRLPLGIRRPFIFCSLDPRTPFDDWIGPVSRRVRWFPWHELVFDGSRSRDYLVKANWAIYCDNYLEGFHIPFVHDGLNAAIDYGSYTTELFRWGSLQLGLARGGEDTFDLPPHAPDAGKDVAAYWFWLFPNLMLNLYPWGLSLNVVEPIAHDRTRVRFRTWVHDASRLDAGAGAGLDKVEREDEVVVEAVQRGVRSRLYDRGRYSPTREQGVHHFHRLLAELTRD